jgi:hypothetical protein
LTSVVDVHAHVTVLGFFFGCGLRLGYASVVKSFSRRAAKLDHYSMS